GRYGPRGPGTGAPGGGGRRGAPPHLGRPVRMRTWGEGSPSPAGARRRGARPPPARAPGRGRERTPSRRPARSPPALQDDELHGPLDRDPDHAAPLVDPPVALQQPSFLVRERRGRG